MPVFRTRISQTTLTWILTVLAFAALLPAFFLPADAQAELRAFRLKITDTTSNVERRVLTRLDHIQYPMYNHVAQTEIVEIEQTWMCYARSDYVDQLCAAPAESPVPSVANDPGGPDRRPASAASTQR